MGGAVARATLLLLALAGHATASSFLIPNTDAAVYVGSENATQIFEGTQDEAWMLIFTAGYSNSYSSAVKIMLEEWQSVIRVGLVDSTGAGKRLFESMDQKGDPSVVVVLAHKSCTNKDGRRVVFEYKIPEGGLDARVSQWARDHKFNTWDGDFWNWEMGLARKDVDEELHNAFFEYSPGNFVLKSEIEEGKVKIVDGVAIDQTEGEAQDDSHMAGTDHAEFDEMELPGAHKVIPGQLIEDEDEPEEDPEAPIPDPDVEEMVRERQYAPPTNAEEGEAAGADADGPLPEGAIKEGDDGVLKIDISQLDPETHSKDIIAQIEAYQKASQQKMQGEAQPAEEEMDPEEFQKEVLSADGKESYFDQEFPPLKNFQEKTPQELDDMSQEEFEKYIDALAAAEQAEYGEGSDRGTFTPAGDESEEVPPLGDSEGEGDEAPTGSCKADGNGAATCNNPASE